MCVKVLVLYWKAFFWHNLCFRLFTVRNKDARCSSKREKIKLREENYSRIVCFYWGKESIFQYMDKMFKCVYTPWTYLLFSVFIKTYRYWRYMDWWVHEFKPIDVVREIDFVTVFFFLSWFDWHNWEIWNLLVILRSSGLLETLAMESMVSGK